MWLLWLPLSDILKRKLITKSEATYVHTYVAAYSYVYIVPFLNIAMPTAIIDSSYHTSIVIPDSYALGSSPTIRCVLISLQMQTYIYTHILQVCIPQVDWRAGKKLHINRCTQVCICSIVHLLPMAWRERQLPFCGMQKFLCFPEESKIP